MVLLYSEKIYEEQVKHINPDIIISYNYKYRIEKSVIDFMKGNVINLHIFFLPWNRGADPNYWSFMEDTPKGVTIHYMDETFDTGHIIVQKECFFDEETETFRSTYEKLHREIQELFYENWEGIKYKRVVSEAQKAGGSFHTISDRKTGGGSSEFSWDKTIAEWKREVNGNRRETAHEK